MGYWPDNPAGDALGRQQAVVQHMRALPHSSVADALATRASLPGPGHHQAGVRVPNAEKPIIEHTLVSDGDEEITTIGAGTEHRYILGGIPSVSEDSGRADPVARRLR